MKTIKKLKVNKGLSLLSRNELTTVKGGKSLGSTSTSFGENTEPVKKKMPTDPPEEIIFSKASFFKF